MKIQCPLNPITIERIDDYIQAGAHEFYLGFRNTLTRHSDCLNRRFGAHVNFKSVDAGIAAVEQINARARKAFIVINELHFPHSWQGAIMRDILKFAEHGAHGFIISDINLLLALKQEAPSLFLALSSTAHVLNSRAAAFFTRFGINRLILPRQLAPSEIADLIHAGTDMEYELIMMNEECPNLEGLCSFAHIPGESAPNICRQALLYNQFPPGSGYVVDACGACALYAFRDVPGLCLKIAGRGFGADWILKDVVFLQKAVSMLQDCASAREFAVRCAREHETIYNDKCRTKCYFFVDYAPGHDITGGETPSDITQGVVKYGSSRNHPSMPRHPDQDRP